jgi:hypothetical protein
MALTLDGTNGISSSGAISSSSNITATGSITTQSATGIVFSDSSSLPAASSPYVLKNRIINGAMVIDQRNAGASVTANNEIYGADRFKVSTGYTSKATIQQSTTAPTGFNNSILLTSSAATSTASGDYMTLLQIIEGFNVADLGWGTANAKPITISFWVRSSLTGTFGGSISNAGNSRSYVYTYTISAANTWEQKTVTIAGDTSGTWLTTNGVGFIVRFSIAMGSTYSTSSTNTWLAGDYEGATGQTQILNTNAATWYVTGVQLEVGSTATPFERRMYSTELELCQRYCYAYRNYANATEYISGGFATGVNSGTTFLYFPVTPRIPPTGITSSGSYYFNNAGPGGGNVSSISYATSSFVSLSLNFVIAVSNMTAGYAGWFQGQNNTAYLYTTGSEL